MLYSSFVALYGDAFAKPTQTFNGSIVMIKNDVGSLGAAYRMPNSRVFLMNEMSML